MYLDLMGQLGQLQLGDILVEVVAVDATLPELPEKVVKVEEEMELPVVVKGELEVMALVEAVAERSSGLRFDLCVGKGAPTTDLSALLKAAAYPWNE